MELMRAAAGEIVPFFQPVLAVDTGAIYGYEVLARRLTPRGSESLGWFFHEPSVSAESKLEVDRRVRRRAMELLKQSAGDTRLFLNIQPQWLYPFIDQRRKFVTLEYLEEFGIEPHRVVIEISETEFGANLESLAALIERYREAGCGVAVDDVGRGFSNLERILALRPDFLKIDAQFVGRSAEEEVARCLLEALGRFAERSGLALVLEGIESASLFRLGLEVGARYYQGYFIAPPRPHLDATSGLAGAVRREVSEYVARELRQSARYWGVSASLEALLRSFPLAPSDVEGYVRRLLANLPEHCFRVYVCDGYGYQVTPNFARRGDGQWVVSRKYLGRNWSWRPYFLRAVALADHFGKGVVSEPYLDLETRLKVRTFCYRLGRDLYLFIDMTL